MDTSTMEAARYPSLANKSVFVTGGATGIGAALVEAFHAQGADVAFVDNDAGNGKQLCDRLAHGSDRRPWFGDIDVTCVVLAVVFSRFLFNSAPTLLIGRKQSTENGRGR
jgi:NAD(P)-dependent dehydrogenase (short-subunit alcohol dehydrogenase family)